MNHLRKEQLRTINNDLNSSLEHLELLKDEEQEEYAAMLKNVRETERGEQCYDNVNNLFFGCTSLRECIDYISKVL